jgi:hypothetical protein
MNGDVDIARAMNSIRVFGVYSLIMGGVLLLIPHLILPLFDLPIGESDIWIRILGFVLCCSSYYYIRAANAGNLEFAKYTVHTRFMAPVVIALLIATGTADWHFLSFGLVDGAGGFWTWTTMRQLKSRTPRSPK